MDDSQIPLIGNRLKAERERLGLTQVDLASRTLVSPNTQVKYEAGTTHPDAVYLAKFGALGADVLYIVTGRRTPELHVIENDTVVLEHDEAALLNNFRAADDRGRKAAHAVLDALAKPMLGKKSKCSQ